MLHTLRRIRGVKRPPLGVVFPMPTRPMVIDNGANADCKPEYLLQFAIMGTIYLERVRGIDISCCPHCRLGHWHTVRLLPPVREPTPKIGVACRGPP